MGTHIGHPWPLCTLVCSHWGDQLMGTGSGQSGPECPQSWDQRRMEDRHSDRAQDLRRTWVAHVSWDIYTPGGSSGGWHRGHCWGQAQAEAELTGLCPGSLLSLDTRAWSWSMYWSVPALIGQAEVTLTPHWLHSRVLYLVIPMPCRQWTEHSRHGTRQHIKGTMIIFLFIIKPTSV